MLGQKQLRPQDVVEGPNGCQRPVTRYTPKGDTFTAMVDVCERCWEEIPEYVGAPKGFVSSDSGRKLRTTMNDGRSSIEAVSKIVCYECYKQDALDMFGVFDDFPHPVKQ